MAIRSGIHASRWNGSAASSRDGADCATVGGVAACAAVNVQQFPSIVSDGNQGAILAWEDFRPGSVADIYAQRLDAGGAPRWMLNGQVVSNAVGNQYGAALVADGDTVAIVAWTDQREGGSDLYAQRMPSVVTLDTGPVPMARTVRLSAAPNPSYGPVTLSFALVEPADIEVSVYDAAGRCVRTLARGARPLGEHALRWDSRDAAGLACAPGAYWARLRVNGVPAGAKALTLQR